MIRHLVNVDVFSFGSVGCVIGSSYYVKLWLSISLPVCLEYVVYLVYRRQLGKEGLDFLKDPDQASVPLLFTVQSHLSEVHRKMRLAKESARRDWVNSGPANMFRRRKGGDAQIVAYETAFDEHQRAFEMDKNMRKLYRKLARKAELQQTFVGWGFLILFLSYPAVSNKIFAFFYCYEIDDNTAFLMADYAVSCRTWVYQTHTVVCSVLIFIIPIGMPLILGLLIWRAKADIMLDQGPHHLENLYKDYKKDCCMWEIYQMLQKLSLIGKYTSNLS